MRCRGFIKHFFQCSECSEHFLELLKDEAAAAVQSRDDAVLWLWRAHNQVQFPLCAFCMPHDAHVVPQVCRVQNMCKRRAPLHVQTASGLLPRR